VEEGKAGERGIWRGVGGGGDWGEGKREKGKGKREKGKGKREKGKGKREKGKGKREKGKVGTRRVFLVLGWRGQGKARQGKARQGKARQRQRQRKQILYPPTHAQNPRVTKVHETVLAKRNKERVLDYA